MFPFGIFYRKKKVDDIIGIAYPEVYEIYGQHTSPAVMEEQVSVPKRGVGDEFYGLREYTYGEDSRLINWKLTAKTGLPLVKEYAQQIGNKITVTVDGTPGRGTEKRISDAASLSKYFIDTGAEVRLVTNETELDYGKGLLHLSKIFDTLALLGDGKIDKLTVDTKTKPVKLKPEMTYKKDVRLLYYLTTLVSFCSLFLIEDLNPWFLLTTSTVLPIGLWFDIKNFYPIQKTLANLISVMFLIFIFFIDLPAAGLLLTVTHLVLYILAYILLLPKVNDNLRQLFLTNFLIFFLVSGQTINLWYFSFFVLYFLVSGLWVIKWLDNKPIEIKNPLWIYSTVVVTTLCFCVATISFAVTPRVDNPRMQQIIANTGLNRLQTIARSFSGWTETVELGYYGTISRNPARIMRVSFKGVSETKQRPEYIRIRGAAFDAFDGKKWQKTRVEFKYKYFGRTLFTDKTNAWVTKNKKLIIFPNFKPGNPALVEDIYIYPLNSTVVFSVGSIAAIETSIPTAYFDFTDTAHFPSPYAGGVAYRIYSQSETEMYSEFINDYPKILATNYLNIPNYNKNYLEFVNSITASAEDDYQKAYLIKEFLKSKFSYSLSAQFGKQNVDTFLFKTKSGNCEYFATSMCVLLRYLNIPARLVIGFLCDEWNEYGKFYDVRQSDAHAWVEAYIPKKGWVAFDPTPADNSITERVTAFWTKLDQYFNAVQLRWYRYVIGYDTYMQRNTFYNFSININRNLVTTIIWALAITFSIALIIFVKPIKLINLLFLKKPLGEDNFYYMMLNILHKKGFKRQPFQTGKEFADNIVLTNPDFEPAVTLTQYFYLTRYAGKKIDAGDNLKIQTLLLNLKKILSNKHLDKLAKLR